MSLYVTSDAECSLTNREVVEANLRAAERAYQNAKADAEDARRHAGWMDQRQVDAGQKVGKLRALLEKMS